MTKRLLVLGAGTAGTMIVNKLRRKLPRDDWDITVVDRDDVHLYQPGLLLLPFGGYHAEQLSRLRSEFVPEGVELVLGEIDRGHLWARRLSADMNHLTEDDLYDEVEGIISASDFIEKTDGAQLLFI
jgi:NADH dehydrogenase FAD-containing subunit